MGVETKTTTPEIKSQQRDPTRTTRLQHKQHQREDNVQSTTTTTYVSNKTTSTMM